MPIFDYKCPSCNTKEDRLVKSYKDIQTCKVCGSEMNKLISSPCFILHGVGITSNGSFKRAKEGPTLDADLMRMNDKELDEALGYSVN